MFCSTLVAQQLLKNLTQLPQVLQLLLNYFCTDAMSPYFKDMLLSNNAEFIMLTRIDCCDNNGHGWFSVQIMDSYLFCCYSMITVFVYVCRFAAGRSISITTKGKETPCFVRRIGFYCRNLPNKIVPQNQQECDSGRFRVWPSDCDIYQTLSKDFLQNFHVNAT